MLMLEWAHASNYIKSRTHLKQSYLSLASFFSIATLICSALASFISHGSIFSTIQSAELLRFGAIDGSAFANKEVWRIITAQLLHSKPPHMLFNVIMTFILGIVLERKINSTRFAILYWVAGSVGILASVLAYPQYVSSGSSQALMGLCAGICVCHLFRQKISPIMLAIALGTLFFQVGLDLYVASTIKAGHVAGFFAGAVLFYFFVSSKSIKQIG